jgi:hypothetical protein
METAHDDNLWLWQGKFLEPQKNSIVDISAGKKQSRIMIAGLLFSLVSTPLLLVASLLARHGWTPAVDAQTQPAVAELEPAKPEIIKEVPNQEPTKPINETKPEVSPKLMEDAKPLNDVLNWWEQKAKSDMMKWWNQQKADQTEANTRAARADAPPPRPKDKPKEWQRRGVDPEIKHPGCPPSLGGACSPTKELPKLGENRRS